MSHIPQSVNGIDWLTFQADYGAKHLDILYHHCQHIVIVTLQQYTHA